MNPLERLGLPLVEADLVRLEALFFARSAGKAAAAESAVAALLARPDFRAAGPAAGAPAPDDSSDSVAI